MEDTCNVANVWVCVYRRAHIRRSNGDRKDEDGQIPLPIDGNYVDGSWELSAPNPDYVRECYNNNQKNKILGENQYEQEK